MTCSRPADKRGTLGHLWTKFPVGLTLTLLKAVRLEMIALEWLAARPEVIDRARVGGRAAGGGCTGTGGHAAEGGRA